MNNKILSIIIPSFNMEKYLEKCLRSLLVDSLDAIEVLIINDGSSDGTSEIAHKFANAYPNSFNIIDKQNGNYGSCINMGLKVATGKYIKVLDADDSFDKVNFELFIKFLFETECDLVISDYIIVNEKGIETDRWTINIESHKILNRKAIEDKLCNGQFQMHAVTYKTDILHQINYAQLEGIPYTDQQWMFLPMSNVNSLIYFNKPIYRYLVGRSGQTVSSEAYGKNYKAIMTICNQMITDFNSLEDSVSDQYFTFRFRKQLELLYYICLIKRVEPSIQHELRDFDNKIKKTNPEIYKSLNTSNLLNLPFKYIKYWRLMNYSDKIYIFKAIRFFSKIRKYR